MDSKTPLLKTTFRLWYLNHPPRSEGKAAESNGNNNNNNNSNRFNRPPNDPETLLVTRFWS